MPDISKLCSDLDAAKTREQVRDALRKISAARDEVFAKRALMVRLARSKTDEERALLQRFMKHMCRREAKQHQIEVDRAVAQRADLASNELH